MCTRCGDKNHKPSKHEALMRKRFPGAKLTFSTKKINAIKAKEADRELRDEGKI